MSAKVILSQASVALVKQGYVEFILHTISSAVGNGDHVRPTTADGTGWSAANASNNAAASS